MSLRQAYAKFEALDIPARMCSTCLEVKQLDDFCVRKNHKLENTRGYICKVCIATQQRGYRSNGNAVNREQKYKLKIKYNMTIDDFTKLYKEQNGKCLICSEELSLGKLRCHVDHDHKTGKVRGILCKFCNNGLGFFSDDVKKLRAAVKYMEKFTNAPG